MPNTYHLWCKWHVMKDIREGLGPLYMKNRKFKDDFQLVVNGMLSIDEFERGWHDLIKKWFGKYCIHGQNIWKEGKLGKALVEGQVLCMDEQYTEKQEGKLHVENVSLNVVAETTKSVISNFLF